MGKENSFFMVPSLTQKIPYLHESASIVGAIHESPLRVRCREEVEAQMDFFHPP
jgi:hypothetical protein